jgi:hypothetical protein
MACLDQLVPGLLLDIQKKLSLPQKTQCRSNLAPIKIKAISTQGQIIHTLYYNKQNTPRQAQVGNLGSY